MHLTMHLIKRPPACKQIRLSIEERADAGFAAALFDGVRRRVSALGVRRISGGSCICKKQRTPQFGVRCGGKIIFCLKLW